MNIRLVSGKVLFFVLLAEEATAGFADDACFHNVIRNALDTGKTKTLAHGLIKATISRYTINLIALYQT